MNAPIRRTSMPITEAVYPRRKGADRTPPEERLSEHRASVQHRTLGSGPGTFRIARDKQHLLSQVKTSKPRRKRRRKVAA